VRRSPSLSSISSSTDPFPSRSVIDEGYGLAYSVNNRTLRFNITTKNREPHHTALALRHYLEASCDEVREVLEKGGALEPAGGEAKAKL
jgi:carnitine O-acetyltransferase